MSIALKFTSLFIRTLAKPIANQIKSQAREHPKFRKACIRFAQGLHRTETGLRMRLLNETEKVRPLNDARAIQAGANFLAESFVFSVAGSMILYESWRARRKEQQRNATVADDIRVLQDEISWIKQKLEQSMIIKRGEDVQIPPDLREAALRIFEIQDKPSQESSKSDGASQESSTEESGSSPLPKATSRGPTARQASVSLPQSSRPAVSSNATTS